MSIKVNKTRAGRSVRISEVNGPLEYIPVTFGLTRRGLWPLDPEHVAQLDEEQNVIRTLRGRRPLPTADKRIDRKFAGK